MKGEMGVGRGDALALGRQGNRPTPGLISLDSMAVSQTAGVGRRAAHGRTAQRQRIDC